MEKSAQEYKDEFIKIYKENIKREGADKLLDYLMNSCDFFTAPAYKRKTWGYQPYQCCVQFFQQHHCQWEQRAQKKL